MEAKKPVLVEARGQAGWIVLDRHERRNALDRRTIEAVVDGLVTLAGDGRIRGIVLAARGTVFCGGADLKELEDGGGREGIRIYSRLIEAIMTSPVPVIARVQGPAAGGGVGIVAACHLAVATPAARFLTPEVRSGLFPLMVHALIEETVGLKRAFAMDLTGRELGAAEARDLGLVNEVVGEDGIDERIDSWIGDLSRIDPGTMRRALEALVETRSEPALDRVRKLQLRLNEIADSR